MKSIEELISYLLPHPDVLINQKCRTEHLMFQLINGTIECGECRNEILHGEEFNCPFCAVSLCDNCLLCHEEECCHTVRQRFES